MARKHRNRSFSEGCSVSQFVTAEDQQCALLSAHCCGLLAAAIEIPLFLQLQRAGGLCRGSGDADPRPPIDIDERLNVRRQAAPSSEGAGEDRILFTLQRGDRRGTSFEELSHLLRFSRGSCRYRL